MVFIIDNQLSRNVLLFSCYPTGQLCLGGPGYIVVSTVRLGFPVKGSNIKITLGVDFYIKFLQD